MTFRTDGTELAVALAPNVIQAIPDATNSGFCLDYQERQTELGIDKHRIREYLTSNEFDILLTQLYYGGGFSRICFVTGNMTGSLVSMATR